MSRDVKLYRSEGDGRPDKALLGGCGSNVIIEDGVRIFHPENVYIGDNVYVGHDTILKGYYRHDMVIGNNVWIGQTCFLHAAGGLKIGNGVGIGPHVKMHAAAHRIDDPDETTLFQPLEFSPITLEDNVNIGIGAIIMRGVTVRNGTLVGAGSVVTKTFPENAVISGVPASLMRIRAHA